MNDFEIKTHFFYFNFFNDFRALEKELKIYFNKLEEYLLDGWEILSHSQPVAAMGNRSYAEGAYTQTYILRRKKEEDKQLKIKNN